MKKQVIEISKILGAIMVILGVAWPIAKPHLEKFIKGIVDERVVSPVVMSKAMNSPFMLDYKMDQKREWADIELHKSESHLKFSGTLVSKTGMNKEAMSDTLASMIKSHCLNKGFITNDQCIYNSKKYGRGQIKLTGM